MRGHDLGLSPRRGAGSDVVLKQPFTLTTANGCGNKYVKADPPKEFYLGFACSQASNTNKCDRENELKKLSGGKLERRQGPERGRFEALCRHWKLRCLKVIDWEGNAKSCNDTANRNGPRDGSRMALCVNY